VKEKEIEDELVSIRSMMERSSKFISLSGLSGILAGVYALLGVACAYYILYYRALNAIDRYITNNPAKINSYGSIWVNYSDHYYSQVSFTLGIIALLVLITSVATGILLSARKAKRKGQPLWSSTSRALLFHMATPLITGGILILILVIRGYYGIAAPMSLIFYGLSLTSASSYTFSMVKYLGLCEIILGLVAACLPGFGLLFWAIGFGVLHIIYGSLMYFKYDR
jgi:hypothetical protein